jgi:hypothetical protein
MEMKVWIIGGIQQLFRNVSQQSSEHACLKAIETRNVRFDL